MGYLPQVPFGLKLPGTDGFSLPQGAVPGGPLPSPMPEEMVAGQSAFGFQPPPSMPPPPSEPDQLQSKSMQAPMANLPTTPGGGLAPEPGQAGDSDKKWGLKQWLPLILGTAGAGIWAGKNSALTDFGTNLLQGAAKQTFDQMEEKRKRQFDLDTANLKQGQEAIKDLIAINDSDLVALQKEVENNPLFAHMAAYVQPLREAKQKYSDFSSPSSDGGTKITAKEAAELSHYYNAIKGAKEAINKFHDQKTQAGIGAIKTGAETEAKIKESYETLSSLFPEVPQETLWNFFSKSGGTRGALTANQAQELRRSAMFAVEHGLAKTTAEALTNPDILAKAQDAREIWLSKQKAQDRSQFSINVKEHPAGKRVVGADGVVYDLGDMQPGDTVPQNFGPGQLERARANVDLLKGVANIKRLAASTAVQKELASTFGANWATLSWSKFQDRLADLSQESRDFINEVGFLTSDKIKEKYGTAFTANEQGQAGTWISKPSDSIAKIMTSMKSFEKHAYNTLESVRDANPTQKKHQLFADYLGPRDARLQQRYEAFVANAKQKAPGRAVPSFTSWRLTVGE